MKIKSFSTYLDYRRKTGINIQITAAISDCDSKIIENRLNLWRCKNTFIGLDKGYPECLSEIKEIQDKNRCNVIYYIDGNEIIMEVFLDNLIKGGAGQAVQNFNIMAGFEEDEGLVS